MKAQKFLATAIMCAVLTLGIGGTSSAAEISKELPTLQVDELASRHNDRDRRPPPPPPPPKRDDRRSGGSFGPTNYGGQRGGSSRGGFNSRDNRGNPPPPSYNRGGSNSQRVDINFRKVTISVRTPSRI